MIGETALSTRTKCDECRVRTATRETAAGVFCETCEPDVPWHANNNAQGASCALPLCTRCQSDPAFFRVKEGDFCSACFASTKSDSSFAATTPGDNVTAAVKPTPGPSAAVTPPSKQPDVLALLFCAPRRDRFPDCVVCSAFGKFGPSMSSLDLEHDAGWHELPEFIEAARARAAALNSTCGGGERTRAAIGDRKPVTVSAPRGIPSPKSVSTDSGRGSSEGKSPSPAGRPGPQDSIATDNPSLYNTNSCGKGETLAATRSAHRIKCTGETRRTRDPDSGEGGFPRRICAPQEPNSEIAISALPQGGSPVTVGEGLVPGSSAVTPNSADAGPYGFGLMQFGCPICARIDCDWTHGPHPDFSAKYAATSASFAASNSAPNSASESAT
jgi:hypothetical protein